MRHKIVLGSILMALAATIAYAASTGDRLKQPVKVGQGQAATDQIIFDVGNGSTNPLVQSSSGGALQLSNDGGTHLLSIPTITDTAVTLAATQTLTNKTLTSPTISGGTISGGTVSGTVGTLSGGTLSSNTISLASVGTSTWTGGTITGTISGTPIFTGNSFAVDGSLHPSLLVEGTGDVQAGNGDVSHPSYGFSSEASGLYLYGVNQIGFSIAGATVLRFTSSAINASGSLTLNNTGGNVPHNCALETASCSTATSCTHTCSASKTEFGGGCQLFGSNTVLYNYPSSSTTWNCGANSSGTINVSVNCCDI